MAKSAKEVWEALEPDLDWSQDAIYVSYQQIKDAGGEPRLAAKFDQSQKLPAVLSKENRFIMPAKNGYTLHRGSAYFTFEEGAPTRSLSSEVPDLFSFGPGTAEHMHLRFALRQGVFNDFLGTGNTLNEAWSGRRFIFPSKYKFGGDLEFPVEGIQIEVDLGLTLAPNELILIEGKEASYTDFNARQLFLPYLDAKGRLPQSLVTPMFFEVHETGVYTLRSFTFQNDDILTLKSSTAVRYELQYSRKDSEYLFVLNGATDIPQANDPEIIIDAVIAVSKGAKSKEEIAKGLNGGHYSARQGEYYAHAGRILGLIKLEKSLGWQLSADGELFLSKSSRDKRRELSKRINSLEIVQLYLSSGIEAIIPIFIENGLGENTAARRASTIKSWANWANILH